LWFVITFMHGIYNCIPKTNHASTVYSVAVLLYLQFVLRVMLFPPFNIFCLLLSFLLLLLQYKYLSPRVTIFGQNVLKYEFKVTFLTL
jgi:uncharacterized protein (DUF486 family)